MSGKGIYDIHCHIVPGVDDGATDIEETGKLLRMEYEQGVRTIIATPHFRFRMFETSAEKVKEQFKLVEKAAAEVASDLHVYLGCEFHTNMEMISMLRENKVMTMAGSRYVHLSGQYDGCDPYVGLYPSRHHTGRPFGCFYRTGMPWYRAAGRECTRRSFLSDSGEGRASRNGKSGVPVLQ